MKYRFLINKSKKPNYASLWQYLTTVIDGVVYPVEVEGAKALDAQVEKMLNEQGYAKDEFLIVTVVDYTIDAKDYTGVEEETEPEGEPEGDGASGG